MAIPRNVIRALVAVCILASTAFAAPVEGSLLSDPGFDQATTANPGAWEFRYVRRMKVPTTRPNWKPEIRTDPKDPSHGNYLSLLEAGQASGIVYIGQIVTLPQKPTDLELSFDYQTYCQSKNRSGSIDVVAMTPEAWNALGKTPKDATKPTEQRPLMTYCVHKQGEDVTEWKSARVPRRSIARLFNKYAGKRVVLAIEWSAWHHTNEEWARFDNIRLGRPSPFVELTGLAAYAYRAKELPVFATTHGWGRHTVRIEYRAAGKGAWQSIDAENTEPGRFVGRIPAKAVAGPLDVRAAMRHEGQEEQMSETTTVKITESRTHPCVFYTPESIEAMRQRVKKYDWARRYYEAEKQLAVESLERGDDPPMAKAGWGHDYVCADCGKRLTFREDHPHKHLCETCNKEWEGPQLDRFWNLRIHGLFRHAADACALVYQIDGDEKIGRRGVRIVDWYSTNYPNFTTADSRPGKGGRLFSQSLSESSWLVQMLYTADLLYPIMTEEERWRFENQLARPCAEHVYSYTHGVHNIQNWKNAALGGTGYFLNDPDMIDRALNDPKLGFHTQIEKGVLEDGMWYERSIGYHYYCLSAISHLVHAALNSGTDLRHTGRLPKMYTAPFQFVQPNFVPPSLNDMGYKSQPVSPWMLEYAIAWYDDEDAKRAAGYLYAHGFDREKPLPFLFGEALDPDAVPRQPDSANLPGMGLAVLRHGSGDDAIYAALEYGEHGGGHGHPDKMQLILYGLGKPLATDLGTTGYGVPMHTEYYKTTPGHNTVTIGGRNQEKTTGKCLAFESNDRYASTVVESDGAYPGYRLVRRVLVADGFVVDVFDVVGEKTDTIDWFARLPGALSLSLDAKPIVEKPMAPPYKYLKNLRGAATNDEWIATWEQEEGGRLSLTMFGAEGTQVAQSLAPGPAGEKWDTLRVHREAASTRFVAVWQMVEKGAGAPRVAFEKDAITVGATRISCSVDADTLLVIK